MKEKRGKMDSCSQDMQKGLAVDKDGVCISKKTKGDCGCEFLKPVSGLECHICKAFLRSKSDVAQHFSSIEHLKIYKVHLQSHFLHQNGIGSDQDSVNRSGGDQMADETNESSVPGNAFKRNLVSDGRWPEESDPKGSSSEQQRTRTCLDRSDRDARENEQENFNESQTQSCNDVVAVQLLVDDVTKDQLVESSSDQTVGDSSERCNTGDETGMDGSCKGGRLNIENKKINDVSVNRKVSTTTEQRRENDQCAAMDTSFQVGQRGASEIKQEEHDYDCNHDDDNDVGGIIDGFLGDSDDDLLDNHGHYNRELIPAYTSDHGSQIKSTTNHNTNNILKVTSAPKSTSFADETSTFSIISSESQWPPIISAECHFNQEISRDSTSENCDATSKNDKEATLEDSEYAISNGGNTYYGKRALSEELMRKKGTEEREKVYVASMVQYPRIYDKGKEKNSKGNSSLSLARRHKCLTCGKHFVRLQHLRRHETIHSNERPYSCDVCSKCYKRRDDLRKHQKVHHRTAIAAQMSQGIEKTTDDREMVDLRDMVQEPENYNHKDKQENLIETLPTQSLAKTRTCSTCGKHFLKLQHLRRHETVHSKQRPYSCDVCAKCYKHRDDLKKHQKIHHRTEVNGQLSQGIEKTTGDGEKVNCHDIVRDPESHNDKEKQKSINETLPTQSLAKTRTCSTCGKHFLKLQHLKRHETFHSNERPYSCDVCAKCYKHRDDLKRHQKIHLRTRTEKVFECDICGKSFYRRYLCTKHKRIHSQEKPYSCDICGKQFKCRENIKVHKRIHTGEKPFTCDICGNSFSRSSSFAKHQRMHSGEKPYACKICGKGFTASSNCREHESVHSAEKPFSCDVCGKSFRCRGNLRKHEKLHLPIVKSFSCDVCGKLFRTLQELKVHGRIHTGVKPYSCNICGSSFNQRGSLKVHETKHSEERPFSCSVCGMKFKTASTCKNHKMKHTTERPYSCDTCGRVFAQSGTLNRHKRAHTKEKPYSCNVCGKLFGRSDDAKVHQKIHTRKKE